MHITHTLSLIKDHLTNQSGAMFGMDARIALIVASVLAATGGITIMSRLDRSRVDAAERGAESIREAVLNYYRTISISQMPYSLDEVFEAGLVEDVLLTNDPWGNTWNFAHFSTVIELEGTEVTVHYGTIHSNGKDGLNDSDIVVSDNDYVQWEPLNDDVGVKFSTRDIELTRLEEFRTRAQIIVDKITAKEAANYLEASAACSGPNLPTWCNNFEGKNYTQFNFYPQSDLDGTDGVIYYADATGNGSTYSAGDVSDMQQLMLDIGLPTSYAQDPWGRILFYTSNATERADPPFTASICYSVAGSCF